MNKCCGEKLAAFGTAIAIQIANGLNADETSILGALFTVIGDQLSLIATAEAIGNSDNNSNNSSNEKSSGTTKNSTAENTTSQTVRR